MSPRKHHRRHAHDLASLYALGALNPRDREKFEEHIEMCASSVQEVTSLLPATHRLAATGATARSAGGDAGARTPRDYR